MEGATGIAPDFSRGQAGRRILLSSCYPDAAMPDAALFALGLALACLAGVRAYLTAFGVGLAALLGWMPVPEGLQVLTSPWVLGTAGLLAVVEFSADKIPGVDSAWDLLNTLTRVPAGAFLASATFAPLGEWSAAAAVAGGGLALTTHALKSGARLAINASPEPVSNWIASSSEDAMVIAGLGLTLLAPILAAGLLLVALAVALWASTRLWRRWMTRREMKASIASQV